jgi:hypothetical protein
LNGDERWIMSDARCVSHIKNALAVHNSGQSKVLMRRERNHTVVLNARGIYFCFEC